MIHDIDVVYYPCNFKGFDYEAKAANNLKRHKAHVHEHRRGILSMQY